MDYHNNINNNRHICSTKIKMIKIEDIIFWILIAATIAILLWLLKGSPDLENALITIGLFIIGSEILLWRKIYSIDKNIAISFVKFKSDLDSKYIEINNKLENIKNLIKRR